jgi:CDP-diacylglycerol--serine O-phosphatidyltransferase
MNESISSSLRRLLPSLFTFSNLFCGFSAVVLAGHEKLAIAAACILAGNVLDGLDGGIARRLGVASAFGLQLDSLADVVTFGMAPSMLVYYHWRSMAFSPVITWIVCAAYLMGGVFRLARFNLLPPKTSHGDIIGLTISISGGTLALSVLANRAYNHRLIPPVVFLLLVTILTLLMVSRVRYPGMGAILRRRWLSLSGLGVAAVMSVWVSPLVAWLCLIGCYLVFGLGRAILELVR